MSETPSANNVSEVPNPQLPKIPRRGGRKGPRPKCEYFLRQFADAIKVIYPSTNSPDKMGILVFKKDPTTVGIARFTQNDKGETYWSPRVIPNAHTGKPLYIYDLIEVPAIMLDGMAGAMSDIKAFFGGTPQIKTTYKENVFRATEERKETAVKNKLKDFGVI